MKTVSRESLFLTNICSVKEKPFCSHVPFSHINLYWLLSSLKKKSSTSSFIAMIHDIAEQDDVKYSSYWCLFSNSIVNGKLFIVANRLVNA